MHHDFISGSTRVPRGVRIAGWIVCLSACVMPASCKKGPDASTPKKAALVFAKAAEAGDMDTVHQVATGTDAEFALVRDYGQEMQAMGRFLVAGTETFGDQATSKDLSLDIAAEFEASDEKIAGETATLTPKDAADASPMQLKKDGSNWKFDLSYLDKDAIAREQSQKIPIATKIWDEGAQAIRDGKYRNFQEALGTVRAKVARIVLGEAAIKEQEAERDKIHAQRDIANFSAALEHYKADAGDYPSTTDGLIALLKQPSSGANWKGPYLPDAVPLDPWKHPYVYAFPGEHNSASFDIHSIGPDGQDGTADDVTNWNMTP